MFPAGPEPPNDSREPGPHVSLRCELRIKNTTGTGQIGTYCIKLHSVGGDTPNFIFSLNINNSDLQQLGIEYLIQLQRDAQEYFSSCYKVEPLKLQRI